MQQTATTYMLSKVWGWSLVDKDKLFEAVINCKEITKNALQEVFDALNTGQRNKLLKSENVKRLFDLYEVKYDQ